MAHGVLPSQGVRGRRLGGFSAVATDPHNGRLWLLSDRAVPELLPIWDVASLGRRPLRIGDRLPLRSSAGDRFPAPLDGEGLVIDGADAWIVSEERRSADRPAQLLRFDRGSGRLRQALPLPPAWRAAPGQGLGANQGPESLTRLSGAPLVLLLAAERPLLQDPPDQLRLLRHGPDGFRPAGALRLSLPGAHWGLTELLALPSGGLLGLVRGFEPPSRWWAQLLQLPSPGAAASVQLPLMRWDLLATGLPPDNWEGLALGPPLPDGRPTLLVVSDDNFSPLQANRLARLAPRRQPGCSDGSVAALEGGDQGQ
ncbi:esterase-like activity of phytase family protein [Synechococcus sp. CS-205]|uniref:esterase-like activity of phytase family protein n=1 Tax=Synechococcus sp. CS-205 TaxID=2847984 RepID=UPI00223C303D|nr:esterase-like activity of phytase family protein [Synechococcus sp. CS-205]